MLKVKKAGELNNYRGMKEVRDNVVEIDGEEFVHMPIKKFRKEMVLAASLTTVVGGISGAAIGIHLVNKQNGGDQ